jgi:hypothetical protein
MVLAWMNLSPRYRRKAKLNSSMADLIMPWLKSEANPVKARLQYNISITVAPSPIIAAHRKPRRDPSLMMVRLTGPTGIDRSRPLITPVNPATRDGCSESVNIQPSD